MNKILHFILFIGIALSVACDNTGPDMTAAGVKQQSQTALELDNGQICLAVSPDVGRIVWFGKSGGKNLLWLNDQTSIEQALKKSLWPNYGGDKIWPAQEAIWPVIYRSSFPASHAFDGKPWKVIESGRTKIVMESGTCPYLAIKGVREISLEGNSAVIKNKLTRMQNNPFPVHIWAVTQIRRPEYCLLNMYDPGAYRIRSWSRQSNSMQIFTREKVLFYPTNQDGCLNEKIGCMGDFVAGVFDDVIFMQKTSFNLEGCYPDKASIEVYLCREYVELETLSESKLLKKDESIENKVIWTILITASVKDIAATAEILNHNRLSTGL